MMKNELTTGLKMCRWGKREVYDIFTESNCKFHLNWDKTTNNQNKPVGKKKRVVGGYILPDQFFVCLHIQLSTSSQVTCADYAVTQLNLHVNPHHCYFYLQQTKRRQKVGRE